MTKERIAQLEAELASLRLTQRQEDVKSLANIVEQIKVLVKQGQDLAQSSGLEFSMDMYSYTVDDYDYWDTSSNC